MKGYTVEDVIAAGCSLEPMVCKFCGSHEVVYDQYIVDAYCQDCGKWQLEEEDEKQELECKVAGILPYDRPVQVLQTD